MRLLRIILATVLGLSGVVAVASPAMADATCPSTGYICLWTGANYSGTKQTTNVWQTCQTFSGTMDENITSIKVSASTSANDWNLYFGLGCNGGFIQYANGTQIADLASGADNKFRSIRGA